MRPARFSILVATAFLAAQVIACACNAAMPQGKERHSCCEKNAPKPSTPDSKSCCCSDGTHVAVAEEEGPIVADAGCFAVARDCRLAPPPCPRLFRDFGRAPPGPGVPLYTLHASLLI